MSKITSKEMMKLAVQALEEKKSIDIKVINISDVSVIADYFIITSGSNINQVQALSDNVADELSKNDINYRQIEGYNSGNWILMDYNDIIIHIFNQEDRLYYDLERIWKDGKVVELPIE